MAILTNGQYARLVAAKDAGDTKLYDSIMKEGYGEDGTVLEAEIEILDVNQVLDAETIQDKLSAGMSKTEIGTEYGVTAQKVGMILKAGGE